MSNGFHFTECDVEDMEIAHPSHWMPLPKPPSTLTDEAKLRRSKALDELGALDGKLLK